MIKTKLDGTSDYAKLKQELEFYKSGHIPMVKLIDYLKKLDKKVEQITRAEYTLNKVLDLINSNEELAHFYTTKKELRKPIEDYFKRSTK